MPIARNFFFLAGLIVLAFGMWAKAFDWVALAPRIVDLVVLAAASVVLTLISARLLKLRLFEACLTFAVGACAIYWAGFAAIAATVLVLTAGLALGSLLGNFGTETTLLRWIAGLGILAAVAGWTLPFPIHFAPTWIVLLSALVWWRRGAVVESLRDLRIELRSAIDSAPLAAFACSLVLILASAPAWLPIIMPDDLHYHLTLLSELREFGHSHFDVGTQVWALAPWSTDVLHALVSLIADREAHGVLNVAWLVAATLLVRSLGAEMGLSSRFAWVAAMLYASLPMTSMLTGSLQVEHATPAIFAAIALLILRGGNISGARLRAIAVLAGFLMATKVSNALLLIPVFFWALVVWHKHIPWRKVPVAAALFGFVGGSSYTFAWALTGNPVLPLFNGIFRSAWFPADDFVAPMWAAGMSWNMPWRLVFDSQLFFEGTAGASGLVLIALAGGVVGLVEKRIRAPLLVALVAVVLLLVQIQYLRYIQPALALLIPALVAGLMGVQVRQRWAEWTLAALSVIQLCLVPTASWSLAQGSLRKLVLEGSDSVLLSYAPERLLAQRYREISGEGDRVLLADAQYSYSAELPGRGMGVSWQNPRLWSYLLRSGKSQAAWNEVLSESGATYLIGRDVEKQEGLAGLLRQRKARLISRAGVAGLYRLEPAKTELRASLTGNTVATEAMVGRKHPVIGSAYVLMSCDRPGEMIATGWNLTQASTPPVGYWEWLVCDYEGRATSRIDFAIPAGRATITFSASPVNPAVAMNLAPIEANSDLRHDLLLERDLSLRVWRPGHCETPCNQIPTLRHDSDSLDPTGG